MPKLSFPKCSRLIRLSQALLAGSSLLVFPLLLAACTGPQASADRAATEDLTNATGQDAALLRAAADGNIFRVRDLLDAGANINARTSNGSTPLLGALYYRYPQTAEMLIVRGADVNLRTAQGVAPLHQAAWSGMPRVVQLLLQRGADPNARTNDGVTPLMWAAAQGEADVVTVLLTGGARPDLQAKNGATALSLAEGAGHTDIAGQLQATAAAGRAGG